eukprot:gb/GECH01003775.1/.p1 GENE.gb/GECH01003775.1/~~gb/GECH01003775.1/.p1  ORF type:complete len:197 (+),score=28.23 gb/GECH01003775.1/:1-591(+)
MPRRIIVGLGNPGSNYINTRHNIGADVLRSFAQENSVNLKKKAAWGVDHGIIRDDSMELHLVVPRSYMNLSGTPFLRSVKAISPPSFSDVLVVLDDIALDLGQIRMRSKGSAGGHNGLSSVLKSACRQDIPRLRLGVGDPRYSHIPAERWVLNRFPKTDQDAVNAMIYTSHQALWTFARLPLDQAISTVNSKMQPK